jgi:N-acyl homoserine lactone hydrolase
MLSAESDKVLPAATSIRARLLYLSVREKSMKRSLSLLAAASSMIASASLFAQDMSLTRLDCGTPQAPTAVNQRFSDTFAHGDLKLQFVFSCYLVKHGDEYLLWDTGHSMKAPNVAPKVSIVDQLAKLEVKPEQIKYVGISHYHGDHTGQVASFPKAILLIGKNEWDAIAAPTPAPGVNHAPFESWKKGESKVEPLPNDKDVWGDGTVIVLATPGHTPGHRSLMVRLPKSGAFILSGDAVHFRENHESLGVPWFNHDRSQTIASIDRIKKLLANTKGTLIIQHDARDIEKLPAFPAGAR